MTPLSDTLAHTQAVFLDIDGTLIGPSGQMSQPLTHALIGLRQRRPDLPLMVCTGRPFGGVASQVAGVLGGPEVPHIFHGGALTRSLQGIHAAEPLQWSQLKRSLAQRASMPWATLELYTHDAIFVSTPTPMALGHAQVIGMTHQVEDLEAVCAAHSIIKMQWLLPEPMLPRLMNAQLPGLFYAPASCDVLPGVSFVTVTLEGVDKGSAIRGVLGQMAIDPAHAIGVGDSTGDVPMLQTVGLPFFMANAPHTLRSSLAHIPTLPRVEEDGVMGLCEAL